MEKYKEIKGFEGLYEVSNYGNIRSLKRNKILRPRITRGYYHVTLCKNGILYYKLNHRLVAEAFIPNPDNLPCVNHKDENKLNNFVWVNEDGSVDLEKSNLEWCTYKYNSNYGTAIERQSAKLKGRKLSEEWKRKISESKKGVFNNPLRSKPVVAVDSEGNVVHEFASTKEASRNGFSQGNVAACCRKCYIKQGNNFYKDCYWYFKEDWLKIKMG